MKTYIKLILVMIITSFSSCEDVIEVEVQEAPSRLVIEASLDWEKGTSGNTQLVKLSTSTTYYDTTTNSFVSGATVRVTNTNTGEEFIFEDQNNGSYITTSFVPIANNTYVLEVIHENETYTATETLVPVPDIAEIFQSMEKGFDDEVLEINISFDDPENEENYYLVKLKEQGDLLVELFDVEDEFTNGNRIRLFYEKEEDTDSNTMEFEPGDIVDIELLGISYAYYNYIGILIAQNEDAGPFGTTPVALRGNCVNTTDSSNYPYGYFRMTQVVRERFTFE